MGFSPELFFFSAFGVGDGGLVVGDAGSIEGVIEGVGVSVGIKVRVGVDVSV